MTTPFVFGATAPQAVGNIAVPDVVGKSRDEAWDLIVSLGLKPAVSVVESTLPSHDNEVYAQDPVSPKLVSVNTIVILYVVKDVAAPINLQERFDKIDAALGKVETEENAKARYDEVMGMLDHITRAILGYSTGSEGPREAT